MNRERAKELLPIIEAFANGEEIQCSGNEGNGWTDLQGKADFDDELMYRIKHKPREFWINPNQLPNLNRIVNADSVDEKLPDFWIKVREIIE